MTHGTDNDDKSSKVAQALGLSPDQTISVQELSTEGTNSMLNFKQLSYSMPEQAPQEWLEMGVKWDSVKYRAQSLLYQLTRSQDDSESYLRHGYGFEGLRQVTHWSDDTFVAYPPTKSQSRYSAAGKKAAEAANKANGALMSALDQYPNGFVLASSNLESHELLGID